MYSWKPNHRLVSFCLASAIFGAAFAPPVVSAQAGGEDSNAGGSPWMDTQAGSFPQAYNAPPGGYSAAYGYRGRPLYYRTQQNLWDNNRQGGIVSSQMQPPVLPEGLVIPFQLDTSIDVNKAEPGDYIQGHITQNISAGGAAYLPGGSVLSGTAVKESGDEDHFKHGAALGIRFMQVRMPTGLTIPLKGHLLGLIGNYLYRNTMSASGRMLSTAWRSGVGSELCWGTGSTFSAITSGSHAGPGGVAYGGALMGGATGLLESLFLRHGHDVFLHNGTRMELQLDEPLDLPGLQHHQYLPGSGRNSGLF